MKNVKKEVNISLAIRILLGALIPTVLMAVVLTVIGMGSVRSGMKSEAFDSLHAVTTSITSAYTALDGGDYALSESGDLMKGSYNITNAEKVIDNFTEGNDIEVTIFYGDVRYATTIIDKKKGERILGTKADPDVYAQVTKGDTVEKEDIEVNGKKYYAVYMPLKNNDGSIVGMTFVGKPSEDIDAYINKKVMAVVVAAIVFTIIAICMILAITLSVKKGIEAAEFAVKGLSEGDLNVEVNKKASKRTDELGAMIRSIELLKSELIDVVVNIKKSSDVLNDAGQELSDTASQTSSTADEIGTAVEDISKGAVSQAEEIENASAKVETMGQVIERIVNSVTVLDKMSEQMKNAGDSASNIMNDLSKSNDHTMNAIERISEQITATNDSVNKISEAIQIITDIAEETNLLSLNASIEAARAGEQGKGFAVVANQIQKLAEQSNESAQRIADIVKELIDDSENTVNVMGEVRERVNEQQENLNLTKKQFEDVYKGIEKSRDETEMIKNQTDICNDARKNVVDVISNLSAISEENAASTEETTASMEELNATINLLAESSGNLHDLSKDLRTHIDFFRL